MCSTFERMSFVQLIFSLVDVRALWSFFNIDKKGGSK